MTILGINIYGHDTAAAVVKDGKLVAAVEEERLTRIKHDKHFPHKAISWCLEQAGVTLDEIDCLCLSKDFDRLFREKYLQYTLDHYPKANDLFVKGIENIRYITNVENEIRRDLGFTGEIVYCQHHQCHLASSYYLSGFERAAVLSVDGLGEYESTVLGYAENGAIHTLAEIRFPHSLGMLYQAFAYYLGFKPNAQEGTVMALASFGNPQAEAPSGRPYIDIFREMVILEDDGLFSFDLDWFNYPFTREGWVSDKALAALGARRSPDEPILQRHMDIAAALQMVFDEAYLHLIEALHQRTGMSNLALAGGCALNCVSNGRIIEKTGFSDVYIQPAASDSGTAIGAALLGYVMHSGRPLQPIHKQDTYLGPAFGEEDILRAIERSGLGYEKLDDPCRTGAQLLNEGSVLGWYQGRMEFGPRALGNRSIVSAPFPEERKDYINEKVKHREWFRPFAPSVLEEHVDEYFKTNCDSPFMLMAFPIRESKLKYIPAVAHVDGTARVQVVSEDINPLYYRLIKEYFNLTGTPVILNTSFNDKGEPIVCTPEDAIKSFKSTKLDALIMGNYLIKDDSNGD